MRSQIVARETKFSSDEARASSAQRGFGYKWQRARDSYLAKHPLCAEHQRLGMIVPATVVDHVVPHKLFDALNSRDADRIKEAQRLFWDKKNWQGLCDTCHNSHKQRLEKSGRVAGCDASGVPLDPNHHWSGSMGGGSKV